MRVLCVIAGVEVTEYGDNSIGWTSRARVDAAGAGGNSWNDPDFQDSTSLKHSDGTALNANVERFIVVPPAILNGVPWVVLGCQAVVAYRGKSCTAVVGDIGPAGKIGEISVACARALGMNPSPIDGGEDEEVVHYLIWPGIKAIVEGQIYELQPSGGK